MYIPFSPCLWWEEDDLASHAAQYSVELFPSVTSPLAIKSYLDFFVCFWAGSIEQNEYKLTCDYIKQVLVSSLLTAILRECSEMYTYCCPCMRSPQEPTAASTLTTWHAGILRHISAWTFCLKVSHGWVDWSFQYLKNTATHYFNWYLMRRKVNFERNLVSIGNAWNQLQDCDDTIELATWLVSGYEVFLSRHGVCLIARTFCRYDDKCSISLLP